MNIKNKLYLSVFGKNSNTKTKSLSIDWQEKSKRFGFGLFMLPQEPDAPLPAPYPARSGIDLTKSSSKNRASSIETTIHLSAHGIMTIRARFTFSGWMRCMITDGRKQHPKNALRLANTHPSLQKGSH